MAFIILSTRGEETGRRQLDGPLTIGRAPDCGLAVRDILMSRHHCRLEPAGGGWVAIDLRSRNGTWLDGQRVGRRGLRHGDELRVGKTTIRFMVGNLSPERSRPGRAGGAGRARPADPFEAMAGTVAGVTVDYGPADGRAEPPRRPANRFPTPRPVPPEPASYARDDLYSMLSEIASSSWDSIYANASRPTRPAAKVVMPSRASAGPAAEGFAAAGVATVAAPPSRPAPARRTNLTLERGRRPAGAQGRAGPAQSGPAAHPPAARPIRPARPVFPIPLPAVPYRDTDGTAGRVWRGAVRLLGALRRKVAPRGSVMLF